MRATKRRRLMVAAVFGATSAATAGLPMLSSSAGAQVTIQTTEPTYAKVRPPGPAPTVEVTAMGPTTARVSWTAVPNATGYVVARDGVPLLASPVAATSLDDRGLEPKSSHTYTVTAVYPITSLQGNGVSPAVTVTMPPGVAPSGLTAKPVGGSAVTLSWIAAPDATAYLLWRNGGQPIARVTGTTYTDQNLPTGVYTYEVIAFYTVTGKGEIEGELTPRPSVRMVLSKCAAAP